MTSKAKILVVDDQPSNVKALRMRLSAEGHEVVEAFSGPQALEKVEQERPDLVLLDVVMSGLDGYEVCRRIKSRQGSDFVPVILVTAKTETGAVVKGLEAGADEYVTKPFDPVELMARVKSMLRIRRMYQENAHLRREIAGTYRFENLIGQSPAMKKVYAMVEKVIESSITVLLIGETGTGKEAFARVIHYSGPRRDQKFVATNCGALPENLLESELFGHKRGAFTGAAAGKIGLFEAADGGTIFLDEVGTMSPAMQVKLLRVLQEREVLRVGETQPVKIDVRVIAAANRDLEMDVKAGGFREDLYYRLSVFPISLPPLRERQEDIPFLAEHFLKKHRDGSRPKASFAPEAMDAMMLHDWPGNVRELENEVQRALVLTPEGEVIGLDALSEKVRGRPNPVRGWRREGMLKDAVEAVEREMIQTARNVRGGNKTRMAEQLGISRWTLLQKMKEYGIA